MTAFRIAMIIITMIIIAIATASAAMLTSLAHNAPVQHAYLCDFAKGFSKELGVPYSHNAVTPEGKITPCP